MFSFINLPSAGPASGAVASSFSASLAATQSQGTVSYSVSSGSLPPGLTLNSSTGLLSGTPATAGTYNFTVTATDDNGAIGYFKDTKSYVLGIAATSNNSNSNSTTTATPSLTADTTDEQLFQTDTETTPDTTSSPTTPTTSSTKPTPAPKTTPEPSTTSVVWWGVGGISLFLIIGLVGLKLSKDAS